MVTLGLTPWQPKIDPGRSRLPCGHMPHRNQLFLLRIGVKALSFSCKNPMTSPCKVVWPIGPPATAAIIASLDVWLTFLLFLILFSILLPIFYPIAPLS